MLLVCVCFEAVHEGHPRLRGEGDIGKKTDALCNGGGVLNEIRTSTFSLKIYRVLGI